MSEILTDNLDSEDSEVTNKVYKIDYDSPKLQCHLEPDFDLF